MASAMAVAATMPTASVSSSALSSLRGNSLTENAVSKKWGAISHSSIPQAPRRGVTTTCRCEKSQLGEDAASKTTTRRELVLQSSSMAVLAAIFHFSGERPAFLGVRSDPPSLNLCPATPNCISTAEEANDLSHYVPPWTYNPEDGRGRTNPATKAQAYQELLEVIESSKPEGFTPTVIKKTDDYIYVEYESPTFGFVDDVEFWFPPGDRSFVEYRSASRLGESDGDANRKRIKFLREELQKKGWVSVGF